MKCIFSLIVFICLFNNPAYCQNVVDDSSETRIQQDWENIVDYINAEITFLYLKQYKDKTKGEIESYKKLQKVQSNNKVANPIVFDSLINILNVDWSNTIEKISKPINLFKNDKPQNLNRLFLNIEKHTKAIFPLGSEFDTIKDKLLKAYGQPKKIDKKNISIANEPKMDTSSEGLEKSNNYNILLLVSAVLFLIISIILFLFNRKLLKRIDELETKKRERSNNNFTEKDKEIYNLKEKLRLSNKEKEVLVAKNNQFHDDLMPIQSSNTDSIIEQKSPEVNFEMGIIPKQRKVVYAGKPTTDNKFSNITDEPNLNHTIYKLTIDDTGQSADFEVILVGDFMIKNVTNSPDDYLYRVCNQENSNKDYNRKIVTTKKGLALLIEGDWVVYEENKATIKFQ